MAENHEDTGTPAAMVLAGQVDLDAAGRLRTEAERFLAGSGDVTLDWHAAEHVGAGAVQVLLALEAALMAQGRALRVASDNPDVRRFLTLAGLSGRFPVLERTA